MSFKIKLPKRVLIPKEVAQDKQYDAIVDYLSDKHGFCVNSFDVEKKKGKVYAKKIDWDTTD